MIFFRSKFSFHSVPRIFFVPKFSFRSILKFFPVPKFSFYSVPKIFSFLNFRSIPFQNLNRSVNFVPFRSKTFFVLFRFSSKLSFHNRTSRSATKNRRHCRRRMLPARLLVVAKNNDSA